MASRVRNHIRSNVVGYIAIFLFAMSGTAIALDGSNTVFSDDIVNGEVKAADIGTSEVGPADLLDGGVHAAELSTNSVDSSKIATNAVGSDEIGTDAVDTAEVANNSVRSGDVRNGTLIGDDVADGGLTGADVADDSLNGADLTSAFGRDAGIFVPIPTDATAATLTTATITPQASGSVLARASGYCNFHQTRVPAGTFYNVVAAIGIDDSDAYFFGGQAYWGVMGTSGTGNPVDPGGSTTEERAFAAERVYPAVAGTPLTLNLFAKELDTLAAEGEDCSGVLTLQEMPDAVVEPAIAKSHGGTASALRPSH